MATSSGSQTKQPALVVGIGASHGGLEALQSILRQLNEDASFTIVIVQHLSDDSEQVFAQCSKSGQ